MKKKETLFIGAILGLALILWIGTSFFRRGNYTSVSVTIDGETYGTYSLSENQTISINGTNVLEIRDGSARMVDADCPDGLCMKQKPITDKGGSIICLPNKVMAEGKK